MSKKWFPVVLWLICTAVYVVATVCQFQHLPARVATHFDLAGHANGWMTRSGNLAFNLGFGLGMPLFFVVLLFCLRFIPMSGWNVPNKEFWTQPENQQRASDFMFTSALWLAVVTTIWITLLTGAIWQANQTHPPVLQSGHLMTATAVFLAGVGLWVIRVMRFFYKIPKEPR